MATRHTELYIIEPAERTNMITNPSFEDATTGYTAVGASSSIARTATYQRRGTYGLDITPTTGALSGVYFGTVSLTSGTTYTFSVDVRDVAGQAYNLYFASTGGTEQGTSTDWTGDGTWKRKSVTWTCNSSTTFRLYLTRESIASTTHFYTDGWQCEAASTASTYLDGDMVGFNRFRTDYGWNGTAHASTSWRTAKTRSGGTLLRVRDYAGLVGVMGLGMPPMVNNSLPSSAGGAFYQNTVTQPREFTILLNFSDAAGLSGLYADRAQIVDAIKPDNVPADEPIVLRWELEDTSGVVQSETLDLVCTYSGGLEYDASDTNVSHVLERAAVTFTAHDPMFKQDGNAGADLTVSQTVANSAYLIKRSPTGVWSSIATVNGSVMHLAIDRNGALWATGGFSDMGGVTNADRIGYYDGSAWYAAGTGLSTTQGLILRFAPDGYPYVGGAFATANGVTVNNIAKWTGSTFSALGTTGTNSDVYDMALDSSGNLYAVGNFSSAGGVAANKVAKWSGSAWTAMSTGFTTATAIAINRDTIYVAGNDGVFRWTGAAWQNLSIPIINGGGTFYGYRMLVTRSGRLIVAGYENYVAPYARIYEYTGGGWGTILADTTSTDTMVQDIAETPDGTLIFGGNLNFDNYRAHRVAEYKNGRITPLDISITFGANTNVRTVAAGRDGSLYIGGTWTDANASTSVVSTVSNASSKSYPIIRFQGPGKLYQIKNYTTGKGVYFDGLTLQAGETAILDLRPGRVSFTSNWRGNMLRYISPGSDLDLFLINGTNNLSCFIANSTGATKAYMSYQGQYWSIDGAAR